MNGLLFIADFHSSIFFPSSLPSYHQSCIFIFTFFLVSVLLLFILWFLMKFFACYIGFVSLPGMFKVVLCGSILWYMSIFLCFRLCLRSRMNLHQWSFTIGLVCSIKGLGFNTGTVLKILLVGNKQRQHLLLVYFPLSFYFFINPPLF